MRKNEGDMSYGQDAKLAKTSDPQKNWDRFAGNCRCNSTSVCAVDNIPRIEMNLRSKRCVFFKTV